MDQNYKLNGINFVWDSLKANKNINNHNVSFEQAAQIFFDPFLNIVDVSSEHEIRDAVIAMDQQWNLLFVVHILIDEDKVRIISARKATQNERKLYEN